MKKTLFLFGLSLFTVMSVFSATPVLAANTSVCTVESTTIVSDETNTILGEGFAVKTYDESPIWTTIPGADWIWKSYEVQNPNNEETITISKNFTVVGTPGTTTLSIAADDYYKVYLNGTVIASDNANLNFLSPQTFILDSSLVSNLNNLKIELTNAAFYNPTNPGTGGTSVNNPAGVIYSLTSESLKCASDSDDDNSSGKSGQKKSTGSSSNNAGEVLGASTDIPTSNIFTPNFAEAIVAGQSVDQSLVMGTTTLENSSTSASQISNQDKDKEVSFLSSFPEGFWCVLTALLIALVLYVVWLLMINNRKDRVNELSQKDGLRVIDFLFFLISGIVTTLILILLAFTCPLLWLWILLVIICIGIHFRII